MADTNSAQITDMRQQHGMTQHSMARSAQAQAQAWHIAGHELAHWAVLLGTTNVS